MGSPPFTETQEKMYPPFLTSFYSFKFYIIRENPQFREVDVSRFNKTGYELIWLYDLGEYVFEF